MDGIRWGLSLVVYAAMVAACVLQFEYAGMGGLAGAGLGFLARFAWPGQSDMGERLGNGYIGSLMGMFAGFAIIGIGNYVYLNFASWLEYIGTL